MSCITRIPIVCLLIPIFQNFILNAAQAQLNARTDDDVVATDLDHIDVTLTCLFTAELMLNMYAHWFRLFFTSYYNLVDLVIISLSLAALGPINLPISVLRVIRAFRVIRIFGRLSALRNIVAALSASLIPVLNSFLIVLLFISICEEQLCGLAPSVLPALDAAARRDPPPAGAAAHSSTVP